MTDWNDPGTAWDRRDLSWNGTGVPRTLLVSEMRTRGKGGSTLSHPLRVDAAGRTVTIAQGSGRHAAEIVGHVLSCQPGERGLAPGYGLESQAGQTVISGDLVASTVTACEPDVQVTAVSVEAATGGTVRVRVTAEWSANVKDTR